MLDYALIEYDMRIKTGEHEKDDLQLIDGASMIGPEGAWNFPFTFRVAGDGGAVDLTVSRLESAVEATVEVLGSEVRSGFDLSLGGLKMSVVAVMRDSSIDLRFKLGSVLSSSDQHCCSFKPRTHGHDTQEIKTGFALISVKVTRSTLPDVIRR
ncbi:hypothetical protein BAE44_0011507 [Dichanthelium oligosanthes]|uniref:DUF6598 domain-containing protein n=1 Tax=Dichanthelium oligosanthes TaxID=888268 RepID=A0A1E5VQS2_9POAL|nr:hypothetical protein BAE44_0011507 [Dichanthelium oligosanthes]